MKKAIPLILAMLGSGLIGGTISNQFATASQSNQSKRIEIHELRLIDKGGNVRGYFGVNDLGVGIILNDNEGKEAITLLANDLTGGAVITIRNRAILAVSNSGSSITLRDSEGRLRTAIGALKMEWGRS